MLSLHVYLKLAQHCNSAIVQFKSTYISAAGTCLGPSIKAGAGSPGAYIGARNSETCSA